MSVRHVLRVVHRDAGYFLAPLVIIYAISGIAVNHVDSWNPSYSKSERTVALGRVPPGSPDAVEREIVARAGIDAATVKGRRAVSPREFHVFYGEGSEATIDPSTGQGRIVEVTPRTGLFEMNVLHLNHMKGAWTWVADGIAVLLIALALSGVFLLPGRTGLAGRGKWFVLAGLALPVGFVIAYHLAR